MPNQSNIKKESYLVKVLKKQKNYPPKLKYDPNQKITLPFLVVPYDENDTGIRPLTPIPQLHYPNPPVGSYMSDLNKYYFQSKAIEIEKVTIAENTKYKIKCKIKNLGSFACYGGMAIFYSIGDMDFKDVALPSFIPSFGTTIPSTILGTTRFTIHQHSEIEIECPELLETDYLKTTKGIVVHIFDPFVDSLPQNKRFDAFNDRHVGRVDFYQNINLNDIHITHPIP